MVFAMSPVTLTRSRRPRPHTSPTSRPIFAGSMSTAPTITNPFRDATWRNDAGADGTQSNMQNFDAHHHHSFLRTPRIETRNCTASPGQPL